MSESKDDTPIPFPSIQPLTSDEFHRILDGQWIHVTNAFNIIVWLCDILQTRDNEWQGTELRDRCIVVFDITTSTDDIYDVRDAWKDLNWLAVFLDQVGVQFEFTVAHLYETDHISAESVTASWTRFRRYCDELQEGLHILRVQADQHLSRALQLRHADSVNLQLTLLHNQLRKKEEESTKLTAIIKDLRKKDARNRIRNRTSNPKDTAPM